MQRRLLVIASLLSFSWVLGSACGGGGNTDDGGSDATTSDVTNGDTGGGDTSNDVAMKDTGTLDAGPDGCGSGGGCRACCDMLYPDAAASVRANEESCACTTPGDCEGGAACGPNLCSGKAPNNACNQCLRSADAGNCQGAAAQTCKADLACAPLLTCLASCTPPPMDAGGGG